MASTTGLLKTQRSRQQAIWNAEDQAVDDQWRYSAQTAEDFQAYITHYQQRVSSPQVDAGSLRTYTNKMMTANKAFTSNEIQRASIDIIEGRQPEEYKVKVLEQLYVQAYQNGDLNLAQNLRLQLDNQYVKMQNAALAAGGGGGGGLGTADNQLKTAINQYLADVKSGDAQLFADSQLTMNQISQDVATMGADYLGEGATPLEIAYQGIKSQIDTLAQYIEQVQDPATKAELQNKLNDLINKNTWDIAGAKLNTAQLAQAVDGIRNGNPVYDFALGENGAFEAKKRAITDVAWGQDANGQTVLVPQRGTSSGEKAFFNYAESTPLAYKVDKQGNLQVVPADKVNSKDSNQLTQEQVLARAGLRKGSNGVYEVIDPNLQALLGGQSTIAESAVFFDNITGLPRFINPDQTVTGFDQQLKPYIEKGVSSQQFISGGQVAPTTTNILGTQQLRDLQTNLSGSALQNANSGNFIQGAGGTTGVLQQAASLQQLQQLQLQEQLRVQQLQQAKAVTVQPYAPPTPIKVDNTHYTPPTLKVSTPQAPALTVQPVAPTAPISGSLQGGGTKLQGGSGSLQGGTSWLQGGSLKVLP